MLFFYPMNFTPICPTEIIEFSERVGEFNDLGCNVVGCSVDSRFSHAAWQALARESGGIANTNISLIADISKEITTAYKVLANHIPLRATFIIDTEGMVRYECVSEPSVRRDLDELLRVLEVLQLSTARDKAKNLI